MSDLFSPVMMSSYTPNNRTATTRDTSKTEETGNSGYYYRPQDENMKITMEGFLQMMVAQFENQTMDDQADTNQMLNQMLQMTTVQTLQTLTDASTLSYAASLVGKEVTVGEMKNGKLEEIVGTVTGTGTYNGQQVIFVDGERYPLSSIIAIGKIPEKPQEPEEPVDPDYGIPEDGGKPVDPDYGIPEDGGKPVDPDYGIPEDGEKPAGPDNGEDGADEKQESVG